jgi:hypothetical protein
MLFYDELKAAGEFAEDIPVFEISNVAQFCRDAKEWDEWGIEELQKTLDMFPPFANFWMEFQTRKGGFQGIQWNTIKLSSADSTPKNEGRNLSDPDPRFNRR